MAVGKASGGAIKAGEAFVELNADDKKFRDTLIKSKERFMKFGSMLKNVGLGVAAIGTSILASLGGAALATLKYIDSIQDVADRTNASTEAVSKLAYAAKLSASSLEDVEAANKKLTKSAVDASNGSEEQATAFDLMGISAEEFLALDMDERFIRIAESLDDLDEPLERSKFLIALLGKSASSMIPLLSEGGEGLRKIFKEAESVGAVIRKEDGKKAAEAMDALDKVLTSVKSTFVELGLAVFSVGEDTKEGQRIVLMYLSMARDWIKENKQVVATVLIIGGALLAVGSVMAVVGLAIGGIVAGVSALITIVTAAAAVLALITVKGLIIAAVIAGIIVVIGALIYAFFKFTKLGQNLVTIWVEGFKKIGEIFGVMWSGILGALKKGDLKAAWEILSLGLYVVWAQLIISFRESWFEFINFFVEGFAAGVMLLRIYFTRLISFIQTAGLQVFKFLVDQLVKLLEPIEMWTDKARDMIKAMRELSGNIKGSIEAEVKSQIGIEKKIIDETEGKNKERKDKQKEELDKRRQGVVNLMEILKRLEEQANKPIVVEPVLPMAPMPREKGKIDKRLGELGASTKGLFDSADFKQALGIGGPNAYAKQAVDLQRDMLDELKKLNAKDGRNFD